MCKQATVFVYYTCINVFLILSTCVNVFVMFISLPLKYCKLAQSWAVSPHAGSQITGGAKSAQLL